MRKNYFMMLALAVATSISAQVKDMTNLIKNPDFQEKTKGWVVEIAEPTLNFVDLGDGALSVNSKGAFSLSQDVTGLENGLYLLQVNGFFSLSHTSWPYVFSPEVSANGTYVPLMHCLEDQLPREQAVDQQNCFITKYEEDTDYYVNFAYYVPRGKKGAAYAFKGNRYVNSVIAEVNDGTLHIQLQNPPCTKWDWTAFGKVRLYRLVEIEESGELLRSTLDELILKAKDFDFYCKASPGDYPYTSCSNKVRLELKNLIPQIEKAQTNDEMLEAIYSLSGMLHRVLQNQAEYRAQFMEACKYLEEIQQALSDEEYFVQFDSFQMLYEQLYNAYIWGTMDVDNNTQMNKIKSSWAYQHVYGTQGIQQATTTVSPSPIYDLQGRQLQQKPSKGMYIQGGKKILNK